MARVHCSAVLYDGRMPSHRPQSAAPIIRTVIGTFAREIPPDVAQIVSITEVTVSPDLAYAKVYVTALTNAKQAVAYLSKHAKRELKPKIAEQLRIYTVPNLRFVIDERPAQTDRIEQLLK